MLPLWIIDLTQNKKRLDTLADLLAGVSGRQMSYWYYSHVDAGRISMPAGIYDASSCMNVLDVIIEEGQKCFNQIQSNGYAFSNFQVCIIGDVEDSLTRSIFHVLPSLLRDKSGHIFSSHLGRGLEVTGMLYVSSTLHQEPSSILRKEYALFLEELNVLGSELPGLNYNSLILFQDVQYQTERYYSLLSPEEVAQLLFQYIVTIYFCGNDNVKLFDSIHDPKTRVYSVGAASVYYNSRQHKEESLCELIRKLTDSFKDENSYDEKYSSAKAKELLSDASISADTVLQKVKAGCSSVDIDLTVIESESDPHPVWDLFKSSLYSSYYQNYIRFLPARLLSFMESISYYLRSKCIRKMTGNADDMVSRVKKVIEQYDVHVLSDRNVSNPTLAQISSVFKAVKERLSQKKNELAPQVSDIIQVPEYLKSDYEHVRNGSDEYKPSAIIERLVKMLKSEPIVLGLIGRCFFLGVVLVFTILPVLDVLSPDVINLGDVMEYKWIWIPLIFLLPFITQVGLRLRRIYRHIRREKYKLLASVLYEINKELVSKQLALSLSVYEALIEECDRHIARIEGFRKSLLPAQPEDVELPIPDTMFNQSLTDGTFVKRDIISDKEQIEAEIHVDSQYKHISSLENKDCLKILKRIFSEKENVRMDSVAEFYAMLKARLTDSLMIKSYADICDMLFHLNGSVDLAPLKLMAGLNGMLISDNYNTERIVRGSDSKIAGHFSGYTGVYQTCCQEKCTSPYLFVAHIHELTTYINSANVCNARIDYIDVSVFHVLLTLYYAFYRRRTLASRIAGFNINISRSDMAVVEQQINGGMMS